MLTVGFVDPGAGRLLERIAWWLHWLALPSSPGQSHKNRLVIVLSRLILPSLPRYCYVPGRRARGVSPRPLLRCTVDGAPYRMCAHWRCR